MEEYFNANRDLWDEWTGINAKSNLYRLDEFLQGANKLNALEKLEVGEVQGKSLLHLQCHFGMDTLSWARLGAEVVGVDFSPKAIQLARRLAAETQIPANFIESDLYDLPRHLNQKFDVVFTSYGVLTWLDNLERWAQIAAQYVKPGGFFYIAEFHPTAMIFDEACKEQEWKVAYDYFQNDVLKFETQGSYADHSALVRQKYSYEWQHTLGEIVSSLINAGLKIEFLHEFHFSVYEMFPFLVFDAKKDTWEVPEAMKKIPLIFSLKASKDA